MSCVSRDFVMSSGTARDFAEHFGGLDKLKSQDKQVGEVAWQTSSGRHIFYLITRDRHYQQPSYYTIEKCLENLLTLCSELKIRALDMPKIGCESDNLDWKVVSRMIDHVFVNSRIQLRVYIF